MADKAASQPFRGRARSLAYREDGQAGLEFTLVLPIFIVFLLFLMDFGMMMYEYVSVSNAVREGARFGSVNCGDGSCTTTDVQDRTISRSGGILSLLGEVTVAWTDNPPTNNTTLAARGDSVVVSVSHPYSFMFLPLVTIPVVSCADMRLEQTDQTATILASGSGC